LIFFFFTREAKRLRIGEGGKKRQNGTEDAGQCIVPTF
jgi:hypothetical protein